MKGRSKMSLEGEMDLQLRAAGLPRPKREFRFHPARRWRADFAWPAAKLLLEVEGGTGFGQVWSPRGRSVVGHHAHPKGYESDCEKYNAATLRGWRVLRVTAAMVHDGRALATVEEALGQTKVNCDG